MYAIEFTARAKKGTIEIPKKYQEQLKDKFRVIILQEASDNVDIPKKKRVLSAIGVETKGIKFDRSQANDR